MDIVDVKELVLERLNVDFLKSKISKLDREPLILRHTQRHLLDFVCSNIAEISTRGFDLALCRTESELSELISYKGERAFFEKGGVLELEKLQNSNFQRVKRVWEQGEYSLLGDVLVMWGFNQKNPTRLSIFGQTIESIDVIDKISFKTLESLEKVNIYLENLGEVFSYNASFEEKYKNPLIFVTDSLLGIEYESLDLGFREISGLDYYLNNKKIVSRIIDEYINKDFKIVCCTKKIKQVEEIFKGKPFSISNYVFEKGCVNTSLKILILSDYELFGQISIGEENEWLKQILPGDFLVHEDHGIGIFEGIVKKENDTYIDIRYAGKDMLLVPVSQSEKVTKYIGGKGRIPVLTSLSGGVWKRTKKKAMEDAGNLAKELLQIYAVRKAFQSEGSFNFTELKELLHNFISDFEYEDTFDQRLISKEIFEDMTSGILMDRLLVGDVGFGKTEIAIRSAFLALKMGFQVAVLAPTTILVSQHSAVFRKRLAKYGFRVETLSRLSGGKEKMHVLDDLEKGKVNLIIGTHSLLSDRVKFKNLGLIIIDEEQKFGVKQKEKLKQKRLESHVLSMSATPIPRSMSMALSGIRDISMLFTPPVGRQSIKNSFEAFDWDIVKAAIEFEIQRSGQVYFVHNRVFDIHFVEKKLIDIFPNLRVGVLHGQLSSREIAKVMDAFCEGNIDVMVSTTIIENGIDLPNVNTLIVDDASVFGLAQLYQIRGRIGRSDVQAYAYFLYKSLKGEASLRLDALMEAQDLGSGFLLANRDLEIRGAGDLLGSSQSGNINSVGYGLFMRYLGEAVNALK